MKLYCFIDVVACPMANGDVVVVYYNIVDGLLQL